MEITNTSSRSSVIAFKTHRVADMTLTSADTWTDVEWDLKIDDECIGDIDYYHAGEVDEDKSIIVIGNSDKLFHVNGCVHPEYNGVSAKSVIIASRIVFSMDDGSTWTEARCLQSNTELIRQADEVGTQHYLGTIRADGETWIKLQVKASSTDLIFSGWATFDNPVAITMTIATV